MVGNVWMSDPVSVEIVIDAEASVIRCNDNITLQSQG